MAQQVFERYDLLLGPHWYPVRCTMITNDVCECVVKYSKLAVEHQVLSVTLQLPFRSERLRLNPHVTFLSLDKMESEKCTPRRRV